MTDTLLWWYRFSHAPVGVRAAKVIFLRSFRDRTVCFQERVKIVSPPNIWSLTEVIAIILYYRAIVWSCWHDFFRAFHSLFRHKYQYWSQNFNLKLKIEIFQRLVASFKVSNTEYWHTVKTKGKSYQARNTKTSLAAGFSCLCRCARYVFSISRNFPHSETAHSFLRIILECF